MSPFKNLCIAVAAFTLSNVVLANTINYDDSVLTPGARLIAGDLDKNEFYILDKDEASPMKTASKQVVVQKTNNKITPSKTKVALNKVTNKEMIPQLKAALKKTSRRVASKKTSKIHVGLKKTSHRVTSKKISKLHVAHKAANKKSHIALKHANHKVKLAKKKNLSKEKMVLNRTHHKAKNISTAAKA